MEPTGYLLRKTADGPAGAKSDLVCLLSDHANALALAKEWVGEADEGEGGEGEPGDEGDLEEGDLGAEESEDAGPDEGAAAPVEEAEFEAGLEEVGEVLGLAHGWSARGVGRGGGTGRAASGAGLVYFFISGRHQASFS